MPGCPHCEKMEKEINKFGAVKVIKIENKNTSSTHKEKFGVNSYPTVVFANDNNKMLGKLVGFHKVNELNRSYQAYKETDKIIKKGVSNEEE